MISVIIPAFDEEKNIGNCLNSLVNQNTTEKFEVIVVDNCCKDKTVEIVKQYGNKLNVRIEEQKIKGRGAARQKGFENANGDILLSTDADTVLPPAWIEKLSHTLKGDSSIAVTGTCKINDCGFFSNTIFNIFQPLCMRLYRLIFGHYWLSGFSFGIYKDAYKKSGGFNIHLNIQEDIDLSFQVGKIGRIRFISDFPVLFSGRRFNNGLLRGLLPYITTYISYFYYKNEKVTMSDVR